MRIAVVSHDAGGSELLCSFISHHWEKATWHIFAHPKSPMALICERYPLPFTPIGKAEEQLDAFKPDVLLFGTGWQEKVEWPYVAYAKMHAIPTVAFLDHWSSYRERFGYPQEGWAKNCGDFSAVHDPKALQLAHNFHLPHPIPLPNLYLKNLINEAKTKSIIPNRNLLFLSEPTDTVAQKSYGDKNYWGFTQYTALEDILIHFGRFECEGLTIRLHPSDTSEGYKKILKKFPHIRVQINDAQTFGLSEQLLEAKMIIGFDTMALYTAALMGKALLSYLPSTNREFLLPLPPGYQVRTLTSINPSLLTPCSINLDDFGMDFALFLKTVTGKK